MNPQKSSKTKDKQRVLSKSKTSKNSNKYNNQNKDINKSSKLKNNQIKGSTTSIDKKNKKIKDSKNLKTKLNEEEKFIKQSQDTIDSKILKPDVDYSSNLISEKKVKNSIKRLIDTSQSLLEEQNNILSQTDILMQNIQVNDHEIDKIQNGKYIQF